MAPNDHTKSQPDGGAAVGGAGPGPFVMFFGRFSNSSSFLRFASCTCLSTLPYSVLTLTARHNSSLKHLPILQRQAGHYFSDNQMPHTAIMPITSTGYPTNQLIDINRPITLVGNQPTGHTNGVQQICFFNGSTCC